MKYESKKRILLGLPVRSGRGTAYQLYPRQAPGLKEHIHIILNPRALLSGL